MEMLDKALEAVVGLDGKPVVLDHPPENLNQIEFGTIGGQKVQEESLLFPDRNSGFELLACVNRRVVDDNDCGASERIAEIQYLQVGEFGIGERKAPPVNDLVSIHVHLHGRESYAFTE